MVLSIELTLADIRYMSPISHFKNLQLLSLAANAISQIDGLENLVNLEILWLNDNNLSEIENLNYN